MHRRYKIKHQWAKNHFQGFWYEKKTKKNKNKPLNKSDDNHSHPLEAKHEKWTILIVSARDKGPKIFSLHLYLCVCLSPFHVCASASLCVFFIKTWEKGQEQGWGRVNISSCWAESCREEPCRRTALESPLSQLSVSGHPELLQTCCSWSASTIVSVDRRERAEQQLWFWEERKREKTIDKHDQQLSCLLGTRRVKKATDFCFCKKEGR